MSLAVSFWGTRGSRPTASAPDGPTARFGGNTSCASVRTPDGGVIILDTGTGIADLGQMLLAAGERVKALILITHTHWDHIQGLPWFDPLYAAEHDIELRGPRSFECSLSDALRLQMSPSFFPVRWDHCAATLTVSELDNLKAFEWGGVRITPHLLQHPAPTFGFRLDCGDESLVYATDNELRPLFDDADRAGHNADLESMLRWMAGTDLLIHVTQYTDEEYLAKRAWGHSSTSDVLRLKREADVRSLALWHHDPSHSDAFMERLGAECAAVDAGVFVAEEGQTVAVGSGHRDAQGAVRSS